MRESRHVLICFHGHCTCAAGSQFSVFYWICLGQNFSKRNAKGWSSLTSQAAMETAKALPSSSKPWVFFAVHIWAPLHLSRIILYGGFGSLRSHLLITLVKDFVLYVLFNRLELMKVNLSCGVFQSIWKLNC